jgi:hypothetical protein
MYRPSYSEVERGYQIDAAVGGTIREGAVLREAVWRVKKP